MKRISRFNKVVIAAALVAASGGASLGITSLVSADNSNVSDIAAEVGSDSQAINGVITAADGEVTEISVDSSGRVHRGPASEALATLFGMTTDELHEALHSGKSLAAIAEEKNVELSKVTDLMVSEFSAHLDEHVAAGDMTREEADEKLAAFTENVDEIVTKTRPARGEGHIKGHDGPARGHGGHHHDGHRHGGHRGFSGNESNEEAPSAIEGTGTAFYSA